MILGLGGFAEAGKDAFAERLETKHGWVRCGCSSGLEKALLILNPWVPVCHAFADGKFLGEDFTDGRYGMERYQDLHARIGYAASKENPEVRRLFQTLGTDVGRNLLGNERIWIDWLFKNVVQPARIEQKNVVITGVRYPQELDAIHYHSGWDLWIQRGDKGPLNDHSSEHSLGIDDFSGVFRNDGTLDDLNKSVDDWWDELQKFGGVK
jgi:hypothetical protein